jgi:4-hydroxybenzoate polyprenyltransferase
MQDIMNLKRFYYLGRFNSLTGAWLLILPSFWSIACNANTLAWNQQAYYYGIFVLGALFMRSFGCVINDLVDINIDKQVARTKNRPLVSGLVTKKEAIIFAGLLLIIPIIIFLTFSLFAQIVALSSLFFVFLYPFSKRFFQAPQLILGIAFNWGILLGDAVINNTISTTSIILYLASIFWTVAYDTVYAYQDYKDDKRIGVKSTAVLMGDEPKVYLFILYLLMMISIVWLMYLWQIIFYAYLGIFIVFFYIFFNLYKLDHKNTNDCFTFFKKNIVFGLCLWLIFVIMFVA